MCLCARGIAFGGTPGGALVRALLLCDTVTGSCRVGVGVSSTKGAVGDGAGSCATGAIGAPARGGIITGGFESAGAIIADATSLRIVVQDSLSSASVEGSRRWCSHVWAGGLDFPRELLPVSLPLALPLSMAS